MHTFPNLFVCKSLAFPEVTKYHPPFRYEPPIETPTEMADRNIKWGGMDVAYVFFLKESLDPKMKKLASNFIEANEEYLTKKAATGKMGFVIERMQNGECSKLYLFPVYNKIVIEMMT
jgi:hypothetical protein